MSLFYSIFLFLIMFVSLIIHRFRVANIHKLSDIDTFTSKNICILQSITILPHFYTWAIRGVTPLRGVEQGINTNSFGLVCLMLPTFLCCRPTVGSGLLRYVSKPTPKLQRTHSAMRYARLAFRVATEWHWRFCAEVQRPISQRSILGASQLLQLLHFFFSSDSPVSFRPGRAHAKAKNLTVATVATATECSPLYHLQTPRFHPSFITIQTSICRNFAYS